MRPALEHHLNRDHDLYEEKRGVVLGTPALLGIFGAVAAACALCFGYGYSSGHLRIGEGRPAAVAKVRPAPRPLGGSASSAEPVEQRSFSAGEVPSMPPPRASASAVTAPRRVAVVPLGENALAKPSAGVPVPLTGQTFAAGAPVPSAGSGSNPMVQIAAVSRAQDAQTLAEALKHDGFPATVRTAPGDKLYHVQIGPFPNFNAAKDMRARLVDNGYNAFIRP